MKEREAREPEKIAQKPVKQKPLFKVDKYAAKMPSNFSVESDIIKIAIDLGYAPQEVGDEAVKFVHYYTQGKGRAKRYRDWNHEFVYGWLDRSHKYGYIKRNGEIYKLDANEERVKSIKTVLDPNFFGDIED